MGGWHHQYSHLLDSMLACYVMTSNSTNTTVYLSSPPHHCWDAWLAYYYCNLPEPAGPLRSLYVYHLVVVFTLNQICTTQRAPTNLSIIIRKPHYFQTWPSLQAQAPAPAPTPAQPKAPTNCLMRPMLPCTLLFHIRRFNNVPHWSLDSLICPALKPGTTYGFHGTLLAM